MDLPYASPAIHSAGGLALGPHFAPLASVASRLVFLNGVRVRTANHNTGVAQYRRMKTGVSDSMPFIMNLIGRHRDSQILSTFSADEWLGTSYTDASSTGLLPRLEAGPQDDYPIMSRGLRAQAQRIRAASQETAASLEETASLLDRLPSVPPFREERWSESTRAQHTGFMLQRARWVFQNDLARTIYLPLVGPTAPWDSHNYNAARQLASTTTTIQPLERFLRALESTSNAHGPLSGNTVVIFGSEIGRFPRLNGSDGKDHLPEIPLILYGSAFNTGGTGAVFGDTDRKMASVTISPKTGRRTGGAGMELTLDDVGATLLHVRSGIRRPRRIYGYSGRVLPFLV